jgi:MerR family transcriptional regulator/heat shock protein HspR
LARARKSLDNTVVRFYEKSVASGRRPVYVISIAASLAGCHPRTLRIYEEEGLLDPVRTDTNIRLYSDEDLERVRAIRYLTQTRGVNLAGVKLLLHLRGAADLLDEIANELEGDDAEGDERVADAETGPKPRNRQRQKGVEL